MRNTAELSRSARQGSWVPGSLQRAGILEITLLNLKQILNRRNGRAMMGAQCVELHPTYTHTLSHVLSWTCGDIYGWQGTVLGMFPYTGLHL